MPPRRLLPSLAVLTATLFGIYGAMLSVLLPAQVAWIAPEDKVAALALVTSTSFAFTILAQPLIGAFSDATRSRLGRRAPWLLGCAVVAAAILIAIGHTDTLIWLVVGWAVLQFVLNGVDIGSSSILVDRIPQRRRGVGASVFGIAAIGGGAGGIIVVGRFSDQPALATAILAVALVAVVVAFVILNRDPSSAPLALDRTERSSLRGLSPRRHPDFWLLLCSRFGFTLGYQGVYGFLFYIVTDHVRVAEDRAPALVGALSATAVGGILISSLIVGWLSDRVRSRKPFLVAGCVVVAAAFAVPLLAPTVGGMFVLAAMQGVGFGLYSVAGLAWASELLPGGERGAGRDLGLLNSATNVGQTVAPVLAATVIGSVGYAALFAVGSIGVLLAAVVLLPVGSKRRSVAGG